jgi:TetR/AcrR family transcriptional regulator, transcriptional repressor of bet genes
MPKIVDRTARRRQVADAAVRLVSQYGLDEVTIAKVAAEAGVSVGLVQHYFRSKDELLLCAFERVIERVRERVEAAGRGMTVEMTLRRSLLELVPLDSEREAEAGSWIAFCARVSVNPRLAGVYTACMAEVRTWLARALRNAKRLGEVPDWLDPELEALTLSALLDGLTLNARNDPAGIPPSLIVTSLDAYLDRIFNPTSQPRGREDR